MTMQFTPSTLRIVVFSSASGQAKALHDAIYDNLKSRLPFVSRIKWDWWKARPTQNNHLLPELLAKVRGNDFAICLWTPDVQTQRGDDAPIQMATANVIFEMGLCFAELGRQRTVIVAPQGVHFFENLEGYQHVPYLPTIEEHATGLSTVVDDVSRLILRALQQPIHVQAICLCLRLSDSNTKQHAEALRLGEAFSEVPPTRIQPCSAGATAIWDTSIAQYETILDIATRLVTPHVRIGIASGDLCQWGSHYYGTALSSTFAILWVFTRPDSSDPAA